jgi:hypothetical protein
LQSADDIHTVSYFCGNLSDVKLRIRLTRRKYSFNRKPEGNEFLVTIGKPNFREREFLKLCKKAKTNPKRYLLKRI